SFREGAVSLTLHKIVVAGCGSMSNTWLDYAEQRNNAEIVGLVDVSLDAAKAMVERRNLQVPLFSDLSQALSETNANLVFDVTIPAAHKQIVTTALEAGCNVFGEKPMAESLEDARKVLKVAQETGKKYTVMQNRRYNQQIRALRDLLASGSIGTIGSLHADFFLGRILGVSVIRWIARLLWIWLFIHSIRHVSYPELTLFLSIVTSLIRQDHGIKETHQPL
ncbi:MAG: gfo/Idh/MocA family oxidoreductase, partial [Neobacillus sp.]|nr:gfo/Idh/MocA family oxidoreductase [Neobacillus sp.]